MNRVKFEDDQILEELIKIGGMANYGSTEHLLSIIAQLLLQVLRRI